VQTTTASLDTSGFWAGALNVPADAANGTAYFVRARCSDTEGVLAQDYTPATFEVESSLPGPTGLTGQQVRQAPQAPKGHKEHKEPAAQPAHREPALRN
jgi:hypothetical protein